MSQTPEMMEGAPLIRPSSTDHPLYDTHRGGLPLGL
jgi:hypothetical protein